MKAVFLVCALALPPAHRDKELNMLEEMIHKWYPNHEIILVNKDEKLISSTDWHTPYQFRGMKVYLRRMA